MTSSSLGSLALIHDTVGQWALWSSPSQHAEVKELLQASELKAAEGLGGVTEVTAGKARVEYRWSTLDAKWREAYVEPLKKAVGVFLEHAGIRGVPLGQVVDSPRVLSSRFVLTNKGEPTLEAAELKARWIFGGHKDPDAGLYPTSSPTASVLGYNLLNFVAAQKGGWTVLRGRVCRVAREGTTESGEDLREGPLRIPARGHRFPA